MDNTREIIRTQILIGKRGNEVLDPKEITLRETVLNWEYGCKEDCKHYKPNALRDYGCEFEECPYEEKDFEGWRALRAESYLMPGKRKLRRAYSTLKKEMPWFYDEKEKKENDE